MKELQEEQFLKLRPHAADVLAVVRAMARIDELTSYPIHLAYTKARKLVEVISNE